MRGETVGRRHQRYRSLSAGSYSLTADGQSVRVDRIQSNYIKRKQKLAYLSSTMASVAHERSAVITPAPMTLPAILQNPKSKTQAQVESYAAQQRERAQALARKHLDDKHGDRTSGVDRRKGEGKRSLRRRENGEHSRDRRAIGIDLKDLSSNAGS